MKKTLLGLIGSPRKFGNCELFVKELFRHLPGEWDLKLIRLPEQDIGPCLACYRCLFGDMSCPQNDDFNRILQALVHADAYVVSAPTYLLGANASLKRFLDRGLSFYAHLDGLWAKPAVGVAIAGIEGMEGHTKLDVDSFIKLTFGDFRGSEVIYGALPGEVFLMEGGRDAAQRLAKALLDGGEPNSAIPVCGACGGDTFRFLPDGRARCMLCSSAGRYEWREGKLLFQMEPGEHPIFLTFDGVKRHADWLRGMKDQFLSRRKELKAVTQEYTGVGSWMRPGRFEEEKSEPEGL